MATGKVKIFKTIGLAFSNTFSKKVLLSFRGLKSIFVFFIVMEVVSGIVGAVFAVFGVILGGYDTTNIREFTVSILILGWIIPFTIAIHRNILIGDQGNIEISFLPKLTDEWKIFFTYAGMMAVPFVLYRMLNAGYFGVFSFQYAQLINLLIGLLMLGIFVRLMFIFPSIALNGKASLLKSVIISRGNWTRLFLVSFLVGLIIHLCLGWLGRFNPINYEGSLFVYLLADLVKSFGALVNSALAASYISYSYLVLNEDRV